MMEQAKHVLSLLEEQGHEAYMVGGCVRDYLLGRPLNDIDICTSALPREVMNIFERVIPTGLRYGTVTVCWKDTSFEVTTFRTEGRYTDLRRPEQVAFVRSLQKDLSRRDFTVNAMAMDRCERLIDYYGGRKDLRAAIIRTVGKPSERLTEDALRMMRAVRFAAQLGFDVHKSLCHSIRKHGHLLQHIAVERITSEWEKLLAAPFVDQALEQFRHCGLSHNVYPFLLIDKAIRGTSSYGISALPPLSRWGLLLSTDIRIEAAHQFLSSLRLSKSFRTQVKKLVQALASYGHVTDPASFSNMSLFHLGQETTHAVCSINQLKKFGHVQPHLAFSVHRRFQSLPIRSQRELRLSGRDLLYAFERQPGPWIKESVDLLVQAVLREEVVNQKNALLAYLRKKEKNSGTDD